MRVDSVAGMSAGPCRTRRQSASPAPRTKSSSCIEGPVVSTKRGFGKLVEKIAAVLGVSASVRRPWKAPAKGVVTRGGDLLRRGDVNLHHAFSLEIERNHDIDSALTNGG